ncbi:uncharacterized protein V6R79_010137 [Siganus canaliculatus]
MDDSVERKQQHAASLLGTDASEEFNMEERFHVAQPTVDNTGELISTTALPLLTTNLLKGTQVFILKKQELNFNIHNLSEKL